MNFIKRFFTASRNLQKASESVNKMIKENPYDFKSYILSTDPFQKNVATRMYVRRCDREIAKRRL